ncbi:PAS domain S-box-containing protein, partial [Kineococcus xinjiangensis]
MQCSGEDRLPASALPGRRPVRSAAPFAPDRRPSTAFAVTVAGLAPVALLLSSLDAFVLPAWLFLLTGGLVGTLAQSRVQRWLAGGDEEDGRLWLRMAVAMVLFGVTTACTGTTFLLPLAALVVGASHIDTSGGRAWRPVAGCAGAVLLALEALVHLGLLDSPLSPGASHGVALVAALVAMLALLTLARTEDDRRALMCEVRSAEAWFRALVQDSHEVLATVCADGTLSYLSPSAVSAWGADPEVLRGTHFLDLLHPEDVLEANARFSQCLEAGGAEPVRAEVRLRVAAGEHRWM